MESNNIKVAIRIRPQVPKERIEMCSVCTSVTPSEPQVWLGKDKAFTFDHVFDMDSKQDDIYASCVSGLIEGCFEGYNATVLAYGQTGSGKTFTMGTGLEIGTIEVTKGIIPRAVEHLFDGIVKRHKAARESGLPAPDFQVDAQFLELYNEDINDLLCTEKSAKAQIKIREDANGDMYLTGAQTRQVSSIDDCMKQLKMGALSRTTGATQMNASSSRSHAIFTLHVKQQRVVPVDVDGCADPAQQEFETLTAKFHFVDLAGSERLKRTGATGDRAKEGISINCGLLALGNVIAALGDKSKRAQHVPYRDSKLTRLLQDSLGGNSRTVMIACISPSDRDFVETLNTLRYANRAKNIKNRVIANQDKSSQTIVTLRRQIQQLELELMEYKQGKRLIAEDGGETTSDMYYENNMLLQELAALKTRCKVLQETNQQSNRRVLELVSQKELGKWLTADGAKSDVAKIVQNYLVEIEGLRIQLIEAEATCAELRRQHKVRASMSPYGPSAVAISGHYDIRGDPEVDVDEVLDEAKRAVEREKKALRRDLFHTKDGKEEDTNGNNEMMNGDEVNGEDTSNEDSDLEEGEQREAAAARALLEITDEITIKEKLIIELEKNQCRLNNLKKHYEDKLSQLNDRIREIEKERDDVLTKLNHSTNPTEESKKRSKEYQAQISCLQNEMKKMSDAKREHERNMKNNSKFEQQARQLRNEVETMKRTKVRLLQQLKDEQQKHRDEGVRYNKKIAQLSKQERLKDVKIRTLETANTRYQDLLKRKDQEVNALKKRSKPSMSDRVAGRLPAAKRPLDTRPPPRVHNFSPRLAKLKWAGMERNINRMVINKTTIMKNESQMERYMQERTTLIHSLNKCKQKLDRAKRERQPADVIQALTEELEGIEENIRYYSQSIKECQDVIMQLEDHLNDSDELAKSVNASQGEELKYLFERVLALAIEKAQEASVRDAERQDIEVKYQQLNNSHVFTEEVLNNVLLPQQHDHNHLMNTTFIGEGRVRASAGDGEAKMEANDARPQTPSPVPNSYPAPNPDDFLAPFACTTTSQRSRRLTKTTTELMNETIGNQSGSSCVNGRDDPMTRSLMNPLSLNSDLHRAPSAPSLKEKRTDASPCLKRRVYERNMSILEQSRRLTLSKTTTNLSSMSPLPPSHSHLLTSSMSGTFPAASPPVELQNLPDTTPPASPSIYRKNREENVFSRLTSSTATSSSYNPDRGIIAPYTGKAQFDKSNPLYCTHIAEGHSRAVLSVCATNDVLFSGSKDCTVKIWDLHSGREIQSLVDHPDSVSVVRYNEYNRLAFSVSKSFIKVWDPRESPARCVKTLNSSGLVSTGVTVGQQMKSTEMAHGETRIMDIRLSPYGSTLFSTSGNIVRFWDLRMFYCIGKLNTGHQASVICMAVEESGVDNNIVITGSKDHYIKLFEVVEGIGGIQNPRSTLTPPHYDGIECLRIHSDFLFSASRDACIKKWDLSNQKLVHSVNQAHRDWVQSLAVLPNSNTLISGCRQGFLKLWSTESCQILGDIRAHSQAINSIDTNASLVFTGSGDQTIGLWAKRTSDEPSPESISD